MTKKAPSNQNLRSDSSDKLEPIDESFAELSTDDGFHSVFSQVDSGVEQIDFDTEFDSDLDYSERELFEDEVETAEEMAEHKVEDDIDEHTISKPSPSNKKADVKKVTRETQENVIAAPPDKPTAAADHPIEEVQKLADSDKEIISEPTTSTTLPKEIPTMSKFDDAIAAAVAAVPECVAAGYVDLESGMLLGMKTVDSHPTEVMDLLAAATADLFQGSNVVSIENIFKQARGLPLDDFHYFKEIIVNSENLIHVFLRSKKEPTHVVTFVCRLSANLGMVLTKARQQVPNLDAAL